MMLWTTLLKPKSLYFYTMVFLIWCIFINVSLPNFLLIGPHTNTNLMRCFLIYMTINICFLTLLDSTIKHNKETPVSKHVTQLWGIKLIWQRYKLIKISDNTLWMNWNVMRLALMPLWQATASSEEQICSVLIESYRKRPKSSWRSFSFPLGIRFVS